MLPPEVHIRGEVLLNVVHSTMCCRISPSTVTEFCHFCKRLFPLDSSLPLSFFELREREEEGKRTHDKRMEKVGGIEGRKEGRREGWKETVRGGAGLCVCK